MTAATKNNLAALIAVVLTALVLILLVRADAAEHSFYASGMIVAFSQSLLSGGALLSLYFSLRGAWLYLLNGKDYRSSTAFLLLSLPLLLVSTLLIYASAVFLLLA